MVIDIPRQFPKRDYNQSAQLENNTYYSKSWKWKSNRENEKQLNHLAGQTSQIVIFIKVR